MKLLCPFCLDMIYSMTGFGKATAEYEHKKITVTIRTLNSKQADLQIRIPQLLKEKELEIRNDIITHIQRGKIDFSLLIETPGGEVLGSVALQKACILEYISQIKDISQEAGIPEPQNWFEVILRLPGATASKNEELVTELPEQEWELIKHTVKSCIEQVNEFRRQEGEMLCNVLTEKINNIASLLDKIQQPEEERVALIKSRLEEGLKAIADGYDPNRLEQEMIYYIEKLDINEEKTRLRNHLDYFIATMDIEPGQGKKLGFIAQEIGREINTMGSKSNHVEMQQIVVQMKDELEQIKEQILNVL